MSDTTTTPPATPRKKPRLLLKLALLFGSPLVLLLLVELVWQLIGDPRYATYEAHLQTRPPHFRLVQHGLLQGDDDPAIRFTMTPGFRETIGRDVYRINSHGMRGAPVAVEKPAGSKRVLILGDSYAFGFGVDEKATIACQLEDGLRARHSGIQVLNMGVPAYQTGQQLAVLTRDGLRFDPDLVVLVYYANDNIEPAFLYNPRVKGPYIDELPLTYGLKRFLSRFILYDKLVKTYNHYLTSQGELDSVGPRHFPVTRSRIQRIADLLAGRGIGFVLVAIPALENSTALVTPDNAYNQDHDRLLAFAKSKGIAVVDFRRVLIDAWKAKEIQALEQLFVSVDPPDSHLNERGYGMLVGALQRRIDEAGLLER